ncbi:hypothetical protein [Hymenobacter edaphi]|uniref:Uncharacterized protein n=1 Tax=Hymenobacter edaphi TaxID=2211146 RepID=A0A328BI21_9BACT|nr:hypothetical protein [Hymenobacter edaphi]RAK66910.1 hypothetical protein DLM85_11935 [Hymenobacter edaphi]
MKKLLLPALLLVTALGSWAFYPKTAEPQGYMMVIGRIAGNGFSAKNSISTIMPDGQMQTQELDAKTGSVSKLTGSFDQLHQAELKKLNELRQVGWRVVNSTQMTAGAAIETTYLLDK